MNTLHTIKMVALTSALLAGCGREDAAENVGSVEHRDAHEETHVVKLTPVQLKNP